MATFDLLQVSMTAVTSDWYSRVSGKPEVNMTSVLRPGTVDRPFARLRRASSTLWTPKSASALLKRRRRGWRPQGRHHDRRLAFGETADPFMPITTCFKRCGIGREVLRDVHAAADAEPPVTVASLGAPAAPSLGNAEADFGVRSAPQSLSSSAGAQDVGHVDLRFSLTVEYQELAAVGCRYLQ